MSLTDKRLAGLVISTLFVERFRRSLWVCYLEFVKEAISDGFMAHSRIFREGGLGTFKLF